jgi:hypothetical protein
MLVSSVDSNDQTTWTNITRTCEGLRQEVSTKVTVRERDDDEIHDI